MNNKERAAMQQALDTILNSIPHYPDEADEAITALREALAEQALQKLSDFHQTMEQEPAGIVWDASAPVVMDSSSPKNKNKEVAELRKQVAALKAVLDAWNNVEQEPVAWVDLEQWQSGEYECFTREKVADYMTPLYAAPVRTRDLTDDEIYECYTSDAHENTPRSFARAVIEADRELNK